MADNPDRFAELVAQVAAAYFANSVVAVSEIPAVMKSIALSLRTTVVEDEESRPTITDGSTQLSPEEVRRSIREDALVSFEDGQPYKTLKRHLALRGLTPLQYREKWGLPADYPMTAPSYSAQRSAIAKRVGLGGRSNSPRGRRKPIASARR